MDSGITEQEFWNMTYAELMRAIDSRKRILRVEAKERAASNYTLADLIGRSVARIYNSANRYPEIYDVYPELFSKSEIEEQQAAKREELSALRFKQFANSFNKRFKEVANKNE